jgi:hypothetical protein
VDLAASVKRGTGAGLRVLWELGKVIVPAMVAINVLEQSGWLTRLSDWLGPLMGIFGLPGEAALALVSANVASIYAGLGVVVALGLSAKETTIVAAMMMINHAAISETALVAKAGARAGWVLAARTAAMVVVALLLNWLLP